MIDIVCEFTLVSAHLPFGSSMHNLSDSDNEDPRSGLETDVLLGIPDGSIQNEHDLIDAAVSRIGGLPALLPTTDPAFISSTCKSCSQPMELLVQLWCPFENSPMDRALYVWGCARTGCQGKQDSVRAWRGLRYNETYAAKLKRKQKKILDLKDEKEHYERTLVSQQQKTLAASRSNPFSMAGDTLLLGTDGFHNNPFSFSAHSFNTSILSKGPSPGAETDGDPPGSPFCDAKVENKINHNDNDEGNQEDKNESDTESSVSSLVTALASTTIGESAWKSAPSYPPMYLSTLTEYLPAQAVPKLPKGFKVEDLGDGDKKDKDITWTKEKYEDSLELDQVFERFTKRVAIEGKQCIRYELGGTPLPFASDEVSNLLWPKPASSPLPTTKPDFKVVRPSLRAYDATKVPRCPSCNASRVFECQLMPNLINILRSSWEGKSGIMTDEERRRQIEKSFKKHEVDKDEKRGMEWGTCLIFSCGKDCCLEDGKEAREVWKEEVVYIQWDVYI